MSKAKRTYPSMSVARIKMLREPGHIYVAHSRYCDWIKLGFSSKVDERLVAIESQYAEFAPFSLMGKVPSTWRAEQQLHRILAPFRARHTGRSKELYPSTPLLVKTLRDVLTWRKWEPVPFDRLRLMCAHYRGLAAKPLVALEAEVAFDRYYEERSAA